MCSADRTTEVSCLAKQNASILLLRHITSSVCLPTRAMQGQVLNVTVIGRASERRGLSRRRCPAPRRLARFYAAASVIFPPVEMSTSAHSGKQERASPPNRHKGPCWGKFRHPCMNEQRYRR